MCLVQVLDGIFIQDFGQMYLLSLSCYKPSLDLFFDGWHFSYCSFLDIF
jgi:hypothetical protein